MMRRRTALVAALSAAALPTFSKAVPMTDNNASSPLVAAYLAQQTPEAVFAKIKALAQPNADRHSAGWLFVLRRAGVPSGLAALCQAMGWERLHDVEKFVQDLSLSYAQVQATFPTVDIDLANTRQVDWTQIHFQATQQFAIASVRAGDPGDCKFDHADAAYQCVPRAQLARLAAQFPLRDADFWRANKCEDKVAALRGWLVSQGLGDLAVGFAGLYLYTYGMNYVRSHAVAVAMDEHMKLWLIDGHVYPADHARFTNNSSCISNKLARLYFF